MKTSEANHSEPQLPAPTEINVFRVKEFCKSYGIGKTKFYEEVACGRLMIFKIGRRTLVSKEAANRWLAVAQTLHREATS